MHVEIHVHVEKSYGTYTNCINTYTCHTKEGKFNDAHLLSSILRKQRLKQASSFEK